MSAVILCLKMEKKERLKKKKELICSSFSKTAVRELSLVGSQMPALKRVGTGCTDSPSTFPRYPHLLAKYSQEICSTNEFSCNEDQRFNEES